MCLSGLSGRNIHFVNHVTRGDVLFTVYMGNLYSSCRRQPTKRLLQSGELLDVNINVAWHSGTVKCIITGTVGSVGLKYKVFQRKHKLLWCTVTGHLQVVFGIPYVCVCVYVSMYVYVCMYLCMYVCHAQCCDSNLPRLSTLESSWSFQHRKCDYVLEQVYLPPLPLALSLTQMRRDR
jgi:hypothetical protein